MIPGGQTIEFAASLIALQVMGVGANELVSAGGAAGEVAQEQTITEDAAMTAALIKVRMAAFPSTGRLFLMKLETQTGRQAVPGHRPVWEPV